MVSVMELWLPILLATVAVFFASFLLHMILRYHDNDFGKLPNEDDVLTALRRGNPAPGGYAMPHATRETMTSPEYSAKRSAGAVAFFNVLPGGPATMTPQLIGWFLHSLLVTIFAAYVASRALGHDPMVDYLDVFRFVGTTAFAAYGLGQLNESIWFGRPWSVTLKNLFDALVYALVTAGVFGWLWPN